MKTAVVKVSGKAIQSFLENEAAIKAFEDFKQLYDAVILVHGAGVTITEWSDRMGLKSTFVNGQRQTCEEQIKVVAAVQNGLINSQFIATLNARGFSSVGLSGISGNSFTTEPISEELGLVGKPKLIGNLRWVEALLSSNVIPVFSSVCRDDHGQLINVNADLFAEAIAQELQADTVVFLSDIKGVQLNDRVCTNLHVKDIYSGIDSGEISGGMIPKLLSCEELLKKGIDKIWIGSSLIDLQSGHSGTWITYDNHSPNYNAAS